MSSSDNDNDTDTETGSVRERRRPSVRVGDVPYFVSSVDERMAGDRRRTMVTISSSLPGPAGTPPARRRPRPGSRREPARRPSPRPRIPAVTRTVPAPATRTPTRPPARPPARPVRTSTRWPATLTLAALGLAVAVPFLVQAILLLTDGGASHAGRDTPPSTAAHPTTSPAADRRTTTATTVGTAGTAGTAGIVSWVRSELDPDAVVVSDARTTVSLRRAGLRGAVAFAAAPRTSAADYVVDVPSAARRDAAADVRGRFLRRSVPLATFSGPDGGSVRQVVRSASAARSAAQTDAELRVEGGRQLVRNPSLRLDAAGRDALSRGRVDLRIETVLGDLAGTGVVQVGAPEQDAAERRAGMPIRSIAISTGTAAATTAGLRSLPAGYRPARLEPLPGRRVRAVWPPALPTASVVADSGRDGALRITEVTTP